MPQASAHVTGSAVPLPSAPRGERLDEIGCVVVREIVEEPHVTKLEGSIATIYFEANVKIRILLEHEIAIAVTELRRWYLRHGGSELARNVTALWIARVDAV
jgi:hypothetical protein